MRLKCHGSLVDHCSLKHKELKHVTYHCYHVNRQRGPLTHQNNPDHSPAFLRCDPGAAKRSWLVALSTRINWNKNMNLELMLLNKRWNKDCRLVTSQRLKSADLHRRRNKNRAGVKTRLPVFGLGRVIIIIIIIIIVRKTTEISAVFVLFWTVDKRVSQNDCMYPLKRTGGKF